MLPIKVQTSQWKLSVCYLLGHIFIQQVRYSFDYTADTQELNRELNNTIKLSDKQEYTTCTWIYSNCSSSWQVQITCFLWAAPPASRLRLINRTMCNAYTSLNNIKLSYPESAACHIFTFSRKV